MSKRTAMFYLLASMAITGSNVPLAKLIVADIPAAPLLALRFLLATVVLLALSHCEPGPSLFALTRRQWCTIGILGFVGSVLFTWFILAGVQATSGASAGIILSALPAAVVVLAMLRAERPRRGEIAMVALAVCGVALVNSGASSDPGGAKVDTWFGNLMIMLAVVCEAAFVVAARGISREVSPLRLSLAVALVSLVACLAPALPAMASFDAAAVKPATWALFVWYSLTASALCTVLWYRGVGHVENWAAGLATAAVPVAALAVSAMGLGEAITTAQGLGAALVVAAIAAGTLSQRR